MVRLALLALFCFNIGTPGEAQMPDGIDSEQGLPSADVTMFPRQLENTKEDGMEQPEQSAWKTRSFSDIDHPVKKLDDSLDSSAAPDSKVKRIASKVCPLSTCMTSNLSDLLSRHTQNDGSHTSTGSDSPGKK